MSFYNLNLNIPYEVLSFALEVDTRIIPILYYINTKHNRRGYSEFTLSEVIDYCNLKPKTGKGKINEQFKSMLNQITNKDYLIDIENNIDVLSANEIAKVKLNIKECDCCLTISSGDMDKVMNVVGVDNSTVICLYLYIKNAQERNISVEKNSIMKIFKITENTLDKYTNILVDVNLIDGLIYQKEKPYVYIHINKINNEILYVGKGRRDRYKDLYARNDKYTDFINTIGKENIDCKIIEYFNDDYSAFVCEYEIAKKYKNIGQAKYCIDIGSRYIQDGQISI